MRKLNISISYFTLEGEFLDEQIQTELESKFGENEAVIAEIKMLEGLPEIKIDNKTLNKFWEDCKVRPDAIHALQIAVDEYETYEYSETFKGVLIVYLNYQYDIEAQKAQLTPQPVEQPVEQQLEMF